jgi:PucR-like helix-turn-helix protein/diguanylate cyclase with GGDEF domain/purine catabolism regulatory family protein
VTELRDPSPYLRGGDLVATNGLWRRRRSDSRPFVDRLVRHGASGLVYGLEARTVQTPEDLVDACRTAGLPLLELAHPHTFSAIAEAVADRRAADGRRRLDHSLRRQEALLDAVARGTRARGVLDVLRRHDGLEAVALDAAGLVLAACAGGGDLAAAARPPAAGHAAGDLPAPVALADGREASALCVETRDGLHGHLVCARPPAALDDDALEALDQARRFLAVELDRQEEVHRERLRFASELIDLVEAGEARPVETAARLERFGLDLGSGVTVLAVALDPPPGDETTVARAIEAAGAAAGGSALVATRGEEIAALLPAGGDDPEALRAAVERATGRTPRVGVGSRAGAAGALQRSLAEARHALRLASAERPVVRWDMLAGHRLLMELQPPEIADAFERTLLAPLDEHDARRGTDLVRTVEVFLDAAGHWKPAADVLHVHVNTLRHRLDRVAALTGRDLARMGDRVDFYLALQVRRSRAARR